MPNIPVADTVKNYRFAELVVFVLLVLFVIPIKIGKDYYGDEGCFQKYLQTFNRSYDNETVYQQKLQIFKNSLVTVNLLNTNQTNNKTAKYGITKYSDMHPKEFLQSTLLPNLSTRLKNILPQYFTLDIEEDIDKIKRAAKEFNIPVRLDWREKNAVTQVINQESCSACWAFSSIGMLESLNAIKSGKSTELSVQQVIDCAAYSDGCNGGEICSLLSWLKDSRVKIVKAEEYPLTLRNGKCKNIPSEGVQIKDYECLNFVGSEEVILALIAKNGPVSVAVNALSWQYYVGGVIQFHCDSNPTKLNHAVEIVGYDLTGDVPYYIAKNSWGEDFGEKGYLYLAIGKNICGLAYEVAVVTLV
ncbi:hypothetical protein NQ318_003651 [Aromia moschata]|uniref:Cathepsin O n=1 Tax=Aromia moschata TaxID=1265417 RepID=A0AAV8Y0T0_9CUCU|nr:hypothetical protein NQ318_003651 [Aromia moschata]